MAVAGDRWLTLPSINTLSSDESCGGWYHNLRSTLNEAAAAQRLCDRGIMANPVCMNTVSVHFGVQADNDASLEYYVVYCVLCTICTMYYNFRGLFLSFTHVMTSVKY